MRWSKRLVAISLLLALCVVMLGAYVLGKRLLPRYATLAVLIVGCAYVFGWQGLSVPHVPLHLATLVWTAPDWSLTRSSILVCHWL